MDGTVDRCDFSDDTNSDQSSVENEEEEENEKDDSSVENDEDDVSENDTEDEEDDTKELIKKRKKWINVLTGKEYLCFFEINILKKFAFQMCLQHSKISPV